MPDLPHYYMSGVGHMVAPEDVISCCAFGPSHPIHIPRPEPRVCACPKLSFPHLWRGVANVDLGLVACPKHRKWTRHRRSGE